MPRHGSAGIEPVNIPVRGGSYSDLIVTAPNLYRMEQKGVSGTN